MGSANPLLSGPTAVITTCIRPPFVASSDKAGYSSSSRFAAPHARRFCEGVQFSVRTLQKGAHLRRNLRGFPRCALSKSGAHLRRSCAPSKQGVALHPVPLSRQVAQSLAAASFALMGQSWFGSCVQLPLYVRRAISARRENGPRQEIA